LPETNNDKLNRKSRTENPTLENSGGLYPQSEEMDKIFNGSKKINYKKGDILIDEGEIPKKLFYIQSGSCKVVKDSRIISLIENGGIVGEVSFLQGCPATASVVACEDTEVNVIAAYYLHVLFQYQPQVAGRFYHYLASVLSKKITGREKNN